jgi:hypothetical protein
MLSATYVVLLIYTLPPPSDPKRTPVLSPLTLIDLTTTPSKPSNKQIDYPSIESLPENIEDGLYLLQGSLYEATV